MAPRKSKFPSISETVEPVLKQAKTKLEKSPKPVTEGQTPKAPQGRKTAYTTELGDMICDLLAEGRTLTSICKQDDIPVCAKTVRNWAGDPEHPFSPQYTRARELGYQQMADQIVDIADAVSDDAGAVAKARLRFEARKWILSKALPKMYGDKVALTDSEGGKFVVEFAI